MSESVSVSDRLQATENAQSLAERIVGVFAISGPHVTGVTVERASGSFSIERDELANRRDDETVFDCARRLITERFVP